MMSRTPLDLVQRLYASLPPGRRQNLMEILGPNVVIEVQEGLPCTRRRYVGIKAYLEEFLFDLYGAFDVELAPERYLVVESHVVVLGRQKGRALASGVPYDVSFVHVWTVEEGFVTQSRLFTDTAILQNAIAGSPAPADSTGSPHHRS